MVKFFRGLGGKNTKKIQFLEKKSFLPSKEGRGTGGVVSAPSYPSLQTPIKM